MNLIVGFLAVAIAVAGMGTVPVDPLMGFKFETSMPAPDEFIEVDLMPKVVYQAKPEYPAAAKKSGIEGAVLIKTLIDKEGGIAESVVAESSGSRRLDSAALEAAYRCKYMPGILDNKPVAVWIQYKVEFRLDDEDLIELSREPEFLYRTDPVYPEKALKAGLEGSVTVKVLVSKMGAVAQVKIAESSCEDCGFNEATLAAVKQYKFKPGLMEGKPVASWVTFEVAFRLQ